MDSNLLGECCEAPAWFVSAVDSGAVCLATEGGGLNNEHAMFQPVMSDLQPYGGTPALLYNTSMLTQKIYCQKYD